MTDPRSRNLRGSEDGDLPDSFLTVLRRRGGWVIAGLVVGILLAAGYRQLKPPTYISTASVSLRAVTTDPFTANPGDVSKAFSMQTERAIAHSAVVATRVQKLVPTDRSTRDLLADLSVTNPANTQILKMAYRSGSPEAAQAGANAFANAYLAYRLAKTTDQVAKTVNNLQISITAQQQRIDRLVTKLAKATPAQTQAINNQLGTVLGTVTSAQQQVDALKALDTTPGYVTQAGSTSIAAGRSPVLPLIAGALVGLVGGLIAARLREAGDSRVWRVSEAADLLASPALSTRPLVLNHGGRGPNSAPVLDDLSPDQAEGFRTVALILLHRTSYDAGTQSLAVLSPRARDGRTQVTARLALAFADLGRNVLAVSADFVRPGLGRFFAIPESPGLVEKVDDQVRLELDAPPLPDHPRLTIVPSGDASVGRTSLLAELDRLGDLLGRQRRGGRVVFVDTPALFEAADTLVLAETLDAALVVVSIGRTTRAEMRRMRLTLNSFDVPIVGVVPVRAQSRWRLPSWPGRRRGKSAQDPVTSGIDGDLPNNGVELSAPVPASGAAQPPESQVARNLKKPQSLRVSAGIDAEPAPAGRNRGSAGGDDEAPPEDRGALGAVADEQYPTVESAASFGSAGAEPGHEQAAERRRDPSRRLRNARSRAGRRVMPAPSRYDRIDRAAVRRR
ncbi:MAG: hypothetical protein ABI808_00955 [Pseudonocardiales bacterium]